MFLHLPALFFLVLVRFPFGFVIVWNSIFVHSRLVHRVEPEEGKAGQLWFALVCVCVCVSVCIPSLVKVNEKDHVVSETRQSVGSRHGDDEGKHVVDEGVKCLTT